MQLSLEHGLVFSLDMEQFNYKGRSLLCVCMEIVDSVRIFDKVHLDGIVHKIIQASKYDNIYCK